MVETQWLLFNLMERDIKKKKGRKEKKRKEMWCSMGWFV